MTNLLINSKTKSFSILIIIWIFVTVFPQIIGISRGDDNSTVLKSVLFIIIILSMFIFCIRYKILNVSKSNLLIGLFYILSILRGSISDIGISVIYIMFFYILCSNLKLGKTELILICTMYQIFILYSCYVNIVMNWKEMPTFLLSVSGYQYNFSSFFTNRNTFGTFLLVGIYFNSVKTNLNGTKKFDVVCVVVIIINLILTLSRGSILSALVFFIIAFIGKKESGSLKQKIALISGMLIIIYVIFFSKYRDFIINIIVRPEAGSSKRIEKWEQLINTITVTNLWVGQKLPLSESINPHNTVLSLLVGSGLYGLIVNILMYVKSIMTVYRIHNIDKKTAVLLFSIIISFLFVEAMVESNVLWQSNAKSVLITFIIILLPHYYANSVKNSENRNIA